MTKKCIYCRQLKPDGEFTLEHVIPQFLGGAYVPDNFKTRSVCNKCNNNLGLFVDAAFEKNFIVHGYLQQAARAFYSENMNIGLPLTCMGNSEFIPPLMNPEEEVCETWLGPMGEQIFWIRPKDERLHWYMGGNPRTAKTVSTRAYFMFSERSQENSHITWNSFRDAFEGKKVKKILCGEVVGADPKSIGFKDADDTDILRIAFFKEKVMENVYRKQSISMQLNSDIRFLAKISIGISYCLFGEKSLATEYAGELYKALWYKLDQEIPKLKGASFLQHQSDDTFKQITGIENSVTLVIQRIGVDIALNINLGRHLVWTVQLCSCENLSREDYEKIGDGIAIVIYRQIGRSITMRFPELISHNSGIMLNPDIVAISRNTNGNMVLPHEK